MTPLRRFLIGSAAGLAVFTGAEAADRPAAAPVEYVRVCTAHGAGFFYIPGTDTCLRIGGRARFSYQYMSSRAETSVFGSARGLVGKDNSGFQSLTFLNLDARTQTGYGTLRTFIRLITAFSGGGYTPSQTFQRFGTAYPALGQDTFGRANTTIFLDKAFIQFAGFTAGRAGSFFDFYAHDLEHFAATSAPDVSSTNLLAYTATFGGGFSATLSVEDPIARRQPLFADTVTAAAAGLPASAITGQPSLAQLGGTFTQAVAYSFSPVTGLPARAAIYDVQQRELVPDIIAAMRYDAPWGAAQISAAMHELRGGRLVGTAALVTGANGLATTPITSDGSIAAAQLVRQRIKEEYGYAIQGGLKLNLPQLATGDVLWLQAAYSEGASSYTGPAARLAVPESLSINYTGRILFNAVDSFIGADGKQKLTETWSVTGAFLHYWTPEWRSAVFGSYAEVNFGKSARTIAGPANLIALNATGANTLAFDSRLRDYRVTVVGANLIWSPVKDLDIGFEGIYTRADLKSGRAADLSIASAANQSVGGIPAKTVRYDDLWTVRMRVQRDF